MDYRSKSFQLHVGGVLAIVAIAIALDVLLALITTKPDAAVPLLPELGSVGATVNLLSMLVWAMTFIVAPGLIFAIGYRYGVARSAGR